MFSKFIESTGMIFAAFMVIAFSVAMIGDSRDSNAKNIGPITSPQVENIIQPAADYSSVPNEYANQRVQHISFPPMHIIVTPNLNN